MGWHRGHRVCAGHLPGGTHGLLQVIRDSGGEADTLMLVGHNPGIAALTSLLADGRGPEKRTRH